MARSYNTSRNSNKFAWTEDRHRDRSLAGKKTKSDRKHERRDIEKQLRNFESKDEE